MIRGRGGRQAIQQGDQPLKIRLDQIDEGGGQQAPGGGDGQTDTPVHVEGMIGIGPTNGRGTAFP